jgi:copper resistance protein D
VIDAVIIGAKAVHLIAVMALFGAPLFMLYAVQKGEVIDLRRGLIVAMGAAWFGWLVLAFAQTANMAGAPEAALDPEMLRTALFETRFGATWLIRVTLLCVVTIAVFAGSSRRARIVQALVSGALVASLALQGHAGAAFEAARWPQVLADSLHALTAGVWIGALFVLSAMALETDEAKQGALGFAMERFSAIGPFVVAALVITGLANAWFILSPAAIGPILNSAYAAVLGAKVAFLAGMLCLAALHRYVLSPRLTAIISTGKADGVSLSRLRVSLLAETTLGIIVLIAAALLGASPPPDAL